MPHEQQKLDNLDCVCRSAYELFIENGIENTTKNMLVERSGLSLSSISRYFVNKLDCVLQTTRWFARCVREENVFCHDRFAQGTHTGREEIAIYLDVVRDLFRETPKLFIFCAECRAFVFRNSEERERDFETLRQALGSPAFVQGMLEKGLADGSITASIAPSAEAVILRETNIGFLTSMALSGDRDPEQGDALVEQFIRETLKRYAG